jgi:S1-C subfamily serine protease
MPRDVTEAPSMSVSPRARLFLGLLFAAVLVTVAWDVIHRGAPIASQPIQDVAKAIPVERGVDKTPLLYEGEYLNALRTRIEPSLVEASAANSTGPAGALPAPGIVISAQGDIVTAISGSFPDWKVTTAAGVHTTATLRGVDPIHGLALLRANFPQPPTPLSLTDTGDDRDQPVVAAIAGPTGGEVRQLGLVGPQDTLLRRLNAVNLRAGELVLDLDGHLRAFTGRTVDGPTPLGIDAVIEIVQALSKDGRHRHPWIGALFQAVDAPLAGRFPKARFVTVYVEPDSPAQAAGLEPGASFVSATLGDHVATTPEDVQRLLAPGQKIQFTQPDGRTRDVVVADRQSAVVGVGAFGIAPAPEVSGIPLNIGPASVAGTHGLRTGDVVEAIDFHPVESSRQLVIALHRARPTLLTIRRGTWRFLTMLTPPPAADEKPAGSR